MMNAAQLEETSEKEVATWLRHNEYSAIQLRYDDPQVIDLEASKDGVRYLIRVKTAVHPAVPPSPPPVELQALKAKAADERRVVILAKVRLDANGAVLSMAWEKP